MQEIQNDSASEELLRKFGLASLEICGASAQVNCLNALSVNTKVNIGSWVLQADDAITMFLNTPSNYPLLKTYRSNLDPKLLQNTRVPQYLPASALYLFGVKADFKWGLDIISELNKGNKVQVCLKFPSHYIALTDYKDGTFTFQDSWPQRPGLKNKGLDEKISETDLFKNLENWFIVYYKSNLKI